MTLESHPGEPVEPLFPSARRVVDLAGAAVRVRGEIALAEQRTATMSAVAATLAGQPRSAVAEVHEASGARWRNVVAARPASHLSFPR